MNLAVLGRHGRRQKELPKAGNVWTETERKLWLDTAASIFKMIYKDAPAKIFPPLPPGPFPGQ
jgi:hypothetical protein